MECGQPENKEPSTKAMKQMKAKQSMKSITCLSVAAVAAFLLPAHAVGAEKPDGQGKGSYARVNGLKMYYEIHGTGEPLVLLHGAFATAEGWATVLPTLAKSIVNRGVFSYPSPLNRQRSRHRLWGIIPSIGFHT